MGSMAWGSPWRCVWSGLCRQMPAAATRMRRNAEIGPPDAEARCQSPGFAPRLHMRCPQSSQWRRKFLESGHEKIPLGLVGCACVRGRRCGLVVATPRGGAGAIPHRADRTRQPAGQRVGQRDGESGNPGLGRHPGIGPDPRPAGGFQLPGQGRPVDRPYRPRDLRIPGAFGPGRCRGGAGGGPDCAGVCCCRAGPGGASPGGSERGAT